MNDLFVWAVKESIASARARATGADVVDLPESDRSGILKYIINKYTEVRGKDLVLSIRGRLKNRGLGFVATRSTLAAMSKEKTKKPPPTAT